MISRVIFSAIFAMAMLWSSPVMADQIYKLRVNGLACAYCAYGAEKKLKAIKGVKRVKIFLNKGLIIITMRDGTSLSRGQVSKLIRDAGFSLRGFQHG